MNDADFEMLARDAVIKNGWKPNTLPVQMWLRMRALELAVERCNDNKISAATLELAKDFLGFLKGE